MGFDKNHVIALSLTGNKTKDAASLLKHQIESMSDVESISTVSEIPYDNITMNGFKPEGKDSWVTIHQLDADEDLIKTFHFSLKAGNYFSKERPSDADGFIINETLARMLEWNDPIGKTITRDGMHKVIGVVKDFIFSSMHDKIGPLIITNHPWQNRFSYLAIRYKSNNPAQLISKMKSKWQNLIVDAPFDYWFLDEAYNNLYKNIN